MLVLKRKYYLLIISPVVTLSVPWVINIILFNLQATTNIYTIPLTIVVLFLFFFLLFILAQYVFRVRSVKNAVDIQFINLNKFTKRIFFVWGLGTLFEIYFSGGLPLIWSFQGSVKDYTDFGINSLHGFMNSLFFCLAGSLALQCFHKKTKKSVVLLILILLWPVLMLGRGILLTALVQTLCVYLFVNGLSFKAFFKTVLFTLLTIIVFGVIGGMRGGYKNPFSYLVSENYQAVFDFLPNGFLWVYIYITSPLGNYIYNVNNTEPIWEIKHSLVNLLPSILRSGETLSHNFTFIEDSLNVSTIFSSSHSDFGFYGDSFLILLLVTWSYFWFRKLRLSAYYILPYSMVFVVLMFSVFYNLFLLQPYIVATIIQGIVARQCYKADRSTSVHS